MSKGLILLPPLLFLIACDRSGARQREPVKIETVDVDAGMRAARERDEG